MQAWLDRLTGRIRMQAAKATAASPSYSEGEEVPLSTDLSGNLRVAGGGGGGAATIADGADVAEGATTDVAVVTDTVGTVSGKLRGLVKIFASVWDSGNGKLKVDASNSTGVGVTGTFWQATQPVSIASMPSTPVTGTFWQATQPISNASLDVALSTLLKPADTLAKVSTVDTITNPLPSGTNILGKVGIDQTTTGVTNAVVPLAQFSRNNTAVSDGAYAPFQSDQYGNLQVYANGAVLEKHTELLEAILLELKVLTMQNQIIHGLSDEPDVIRRDL